MNISQICTVDFSKCDQKVFDSMKTNSCIKALTIISRNPRINKLPDGLHIGGYVDISRCKGIEDLPGGLRVLHGIMMIETRIKEIHSDVVVLGEIDLHGSQRFNKIPENFTVYDDLCLSGIPISNLPKGLHVLGNLFVRNCEFLKDLPDDLRVSGTIYYSEKTGFYRDKRKFNKLIKRLNLRIPPDSDLYSIQLW